MKYIRIFILLFSVSLNAFASDSFITISYHEVKDGLVGDMDPDQLAVSTQQLTNQFSWLRAHNYHVVSLDQILAARSGKAALPENSVLLTFDDGYASFYEYVFPLLKLYGYPAIVAVVGEWMDTDSTSMVSYGDKQKIPRSNFLSWDQINEMRKSGLVEVASHSYDLHRGVTGNPQGNTQPAAVTRIYDPVTKTYENDVAYHARVRKDLENSKSIILEHTGFAPRVIVWPYGAYNATTVNIAKQLGMTVSMGLGIGDSKIDNLSNVNRILIQENPDLQDFVYELRHLYPEDPRRVVHVDLDYIYDEDDAQTNKNLGRLLERILAMKVNTVFLQAYADPDGDGTASEVYFPNRHMPVRSDLFNRVAWQLKTRASVKVYAWMPILSFDIAEAEDSWKVHQLIEGKIVSLKRDYRRLSHAHPDVRRVIGEIYADLAKYTSFEGLLFHDDGYLSDNEDVNPIALKQLFVNYGLDTTDIDTLSNEKVKLNWSKAKTQSLIDFTKFIENVVKQHRPELMVARNMYARPLIQPESEAWFAQSYPQFLKHYDFTAIMAMPWMEKAAEPEEWLKTVVDKAKTFPQSMDKTIFELQTVDWNTGKKISDEMIVDQMNILRRKGAGQFGYYPDDLFSDHPSLSKMKSSMSLRTYPFGP